MNEPNVTTSCPVCGGHLLGDGYTDVVHCERVDLTGPSYCFEPDAGPIHCGHRVVTVCDKCFNASCWHGELMCEESRSAGTVEKTVGWLMENSTEDPSWYSVEKCMLVTGQEPEYRTKSYGIRKRFGMTAEDEIVKDLVAEINRSSKEES